jgi:hypothetical protein
MESKTKQELRWKKYSLHCFLGIYCAEHRQKTE